MKPSAIHRLRKKLRADESVFGLWVTLEATAVTDIAAGLGLDWVVIDADKGHLDWAEILEHVRATNRSSTLSLVRVSDARPELIQRAISIGADGIAVSKIETAAQLHSAIELAHYETARTRVRRSAVFDQSCDMSDGGVPEKALILPMIETLHGLRNVDDLLQVDGVDVFIFHALSDLGEMQFASQAEAAAVDFPCTGIVENIRKNGKSAGVVAVSDDSLTRHRDYGFRMLGLGFDSDIIGEGIRGALDVTTKPENRKPIHPSVPKRVTDMGLAASRKETRN